MTSRSVNPLPRGGSLNFPSPQSSAAGGLFWAIIRFLTPKQTARADFLDAQVAHLVAVGRRDRRAQRETGKRLVEAGKRRLMVGA